MKKNASTLLFVLALVFSALSTLAFTNDYAAKATPTPTKTPRPTRTATATVISPRTTASATATETAVDDSALDALAPSAAVTPGPMTSTVLIYNPGTSAANAVLHIYNPNGSEIYTSSPQPIAPKGAKTIPMPPSLPNAFIGSARVTSDNPVQAMVLNANASNTARDIYEGTALLATTLTFPAFRHLGNIAQKSIIAVHNPDPSASTDVNLHYYNANGSEATGSPLTTNLAPLASAYFDSQLLFGTAAFTYTVRIDSTGNIAGADQVLFAKDTASMRALTPADQGTELVLDWIERKVNASKVVLNWSEIYVQNRGANTANATITYYTNLGTVKTTQTQAIPPNGYALFNTNRLTALGSAFIGFAKITQTGSEPLAAQWLEINAGGAQFYAYNAIPPTQYAALWACGSVRRITTSPTQSTTLRIVNVDSATANLSVNLYAANNGQQKVSKPFTLGAGKQLSIVLSGTAFSGVGGSYAGLGMVQSTNGKKIVVTAYTTNGSGGVTSYTCNNLP